MPPLKTFSRYLRRRVFLLGLCLVVMLGWVGPVLSNQYFVAPWVWTNINHDTNEIVTLSYSSSDEAIQGATQFLQEHDQPRNVGGHRDGTQSCHLEVVSFLPGSYHVMNIWNDGSGDFPFCNNDNIYDNIIIFGTQGFDVGKNAGGCDCNDGNGGSGLPAPGSAVKNDPVNTATGNKFEQETDYTAPDGLLTFRRFYNSVTIESKAFRPLGLPWRHSFERSLEMLDFGNGDSQYIQVNRPDGGSNQFTFSSSTHLWRPDSDVQDVLTSTNDDKGHPASYTLTLANIQQVETYFADGRLNQVRDMKSGQVLYSTTYSDASTPANIAPKPNLLIAVTDVNGRTLHFTYDAQSHLHSMVAPDGSVTTYGYVTDTSPLSSVTYADGSTRQYLYNEPDKNGGVEHPYLMTGTVDEHGVRYETTIYDSEGRVASSAKPGGVDSLTLDISTGKITTALGASTFLSFWNSNGRLLISSSNSPCGPLCGQPWHTASYDSNGNRTLTGDFKGNGSSATYDTHNLPITQVEASGESIKRTIETTWDSAGRVPLTRTKKDGQGVVVQSQAWTYNARHQITAECEFDVTVNASYACGSQVDAPAGVSQTRYTYCDAIDTIQCPQAGLRLSVDGPRTDVTDMTTMAYYLTTDESGCGAFAGPCHRAGDPSSVTDAAGHITAVVTYDTAGRAVRRRDANGVLKDIVYDVRGRPLAVTTRANADGAPSPADATTTLEYDLTGLVHRVTDPDGIVLTFGYDDAHRLIDVADGIGNHRHYALDAAGNRIQEQILDAAGAVTWSVGRTYNSLDQLIRVTDGRGQVAFDASDETSYDDNGNLVHFIDANGIKHQDGYDALNRVISSVEDAQGPTHITSNTTTNFTRDALDRLTSVTDPDGLTTTYGFDGLGHPSAVTSPDTGGNSSTSDVAGNLLTRTDAKGATATHAYDVLGRLISDSYADIQLNVSYHYDETNTTTGCTRSYPIGHVTRIVESAVTTTYCYDNEGRVTEKRQTQEAVTDTTGYTYTRAGRLSAISLPSGTIVTYDRNTLGQVTAVTATPLNGTAIPIANSVTYLPFGPVTGYTFGNGQRITRAYDANYQPTDVNSANFNAHYQRDAAGRIVGFGDTPTDQAAETYVYDRLDRLTAVQSATFNESYTYSKAGDRLSKTSNGVLAGDTGTYTYQPSSHWLTDIGGLEKAFDANGSLIQSDYPGGQITYQYDDRGLLKEVDTDGFMEAMFTYNALGQRVYKSASAGRTKRFVYAEDGQLLGEYDGLSREYVWMDGLPIGALDVNGAAFVVADGMGTPRRVDEGDASGRYWQWPAKANPFGEGQSFIGNYIFNLRFPGQYADPEIGVVYNNHRYYDSNTGRYIQSDPIGLAGGSSTYGYAGQSPLGNVDPSGLASGPPPGIPPEVEARMENVPEVLEITERLDEEAREEAQEDAIRNHTGIYSTPPNPYAQDIILGECKTPETMATVGPAGVNGGVYALVNSEGRVVYWGRTNDFERRAAEHGRTPGKMDYAFQPRYYTNDYDLQRGIEQTMMEQSPGSLNMRNSISPRNPMKEQLMRNAQDFLNSGQ